MSTTLFAVRGKLLRHQAGHILIVTGFYQWREGDDAEKQREIPRFLFHYRGVLTVVFAPISALFITTVEVVSNRRRGKAGYR